MFSSISSIELGLIITTRVINVYLCQAHKARIKIYTKVIIVLVLPLSSLRGQDHVNIKARVEKEQGADRLKQKNVTGFMLILFSPLLSSRAWSHIVRQRHDIYIYIYIVFFFAHS